MALSCINSALSIRWPDFAPRAMKKILCTLWEHPTTDQILVVPGNRRSTRAPNSVARYLQDHTFGQNKFIVLERIQGELTLVAAQSTIVGARRYMLPGRELVDVENCHIIEEAQQSERVIHSTCRNVNGSLKAQLFTEPTRNPIMADQFGPETWCVWDETEPDSIRRFLDEDKARKHFRGAMVHGTNGFA